MIAPKLDELPVAPALKAVFLRTNIPHAEKVVLTGDFTNWSPTGIPLRRGWENDWHATLKLPPGEYQYRLIVDGQWKDHEEARMRVPNAYGSENCILIVH